MFNVGNCLTDDAQDTASLFVNEIGDAFYSATEGRTMDSQSFLGVIVNDNAITARVLL